MGCAASALSHRKIEPEQKPITEKQKGDEKDGQISTVLQKHSEENILQSQGQPDQLILNNDHSEQNSQSGPQNQLSQLQLCTSDSNSQKDQIHEREPPSQPQKVWLLRGWQWRCPLKRKGNSNELKHVNGQVSPDTPQSHTRRSSELEKQIQPDQMHEQVLPNQPHLYPNLQELEEMHQDKLSAQQDALQSRAEGNQNKPECKHENDSSMKSHHTSTVCELKKNDQTEQTLEQETQDQNSSTQENQNTKETALERFVPNSNLESEVENQLKPEQKPEPPTQLQHGDINRTEQSLQAKMLPNPSNTPQESENLAKHAHEQNPPNVKQNEPVQALLGNLPKHPPSLCPDIELENQSEQTPPDERQRRKRKKEKQKERVRELLPSNTSNSLENSELESQLNEQKPSSQPQLNGWQSREPEKQTQPQQACEGKNLINGQKHQCQSTVSDCGQSKPEQANQTVPESLQEDLPRQEPVESQSRELDEPSDLSISIPKHWTPHPGMTVHMVTLSQDAPEYQRVLKQIQGTHGSLSIQKIERVQNPGLYQSYMLRKQKMDRDNGTIDNEKCLFHGASHKSMLAIKTHGFNRKTCGVQKKAYGRGLYFTKDAFYAVGYARSGDEDADICYLYLTRVLVGQYCQGKASMILPPPKQPSIPETLYESVVDNTDDPSIFVVFYGNQCYPEYLATLQRDDS